MWDSSEGRPCEPEEGRGEPERSIAGSPGPDGSPASGGRGSGWLEEGRGGALHAERFFFETHAERIDLDGFGFFIVGLDATNSVLSLDWMRIFFSLTFCWIQTFGFWMPVHSQE